MKTLYIMRHAKSDWVTDSSSDFERPLNKRGRSDLPRMAHVIEAAGSPDQIISSPAQRARQTAEGVAAALHSTADVIFHDELYLASPSTLTKVLATTPDTTETALIIGHNPGVEEWATALSGANVRLPTAAVVCLQLHTSAWNAIEDGCAELQWMTIPRLLKALEES